MTLPGDATQLGQPRSASRAAHILLHEVDLRCRHVELGLVGKLELQVFFDLTLFVDQLDSAIEIVTPENIAFRYEVAGPFRRMPAFLIDFAIRLGVMFIQRVLPHQFLIASIEWRDDNKRAPFSLCIKH